MCCFVILLFCFVHAVVVYPVLVVAGPVIGVCLRIDVPIKAPFAQGLVKSLLQDRM